MGDEPRGLTSADADRRRAEAGANQLPTPRRQPAWRRLLAEMSHFFALMLWCAGGLAFIAGMPALGVAIFVVIVVNGVFAFVQEERAEHAAARLRDLLPSGVRVRRDGMVVDLPASELVPDDVVLLSAGDRVPADVHLMRAQGVRIDESMLTGESVPVPMTTGEDANAGTFVVDGDAEALVVRIGGATRLAEIAGLTAGVRRRRSPLALEIGRVVRTVAVVAVIAGIGFFGMALLTGTPAEDGFLFAIGVTVALVPEGLLPTVTLSLAMGAQRMAARCGLVRHLEAVETLGSTTFICTDKTGTLTLNQMGVVQVWTPAGPVRISGDGYDPHGEVDAASRARNAARIAVDAARRCSQGRIVERDGIWDPVGDPMEAAIDTAYRRLGDHSGEPVEATTSGHRPFDPERRRESVVSEGWLVVKGAPESVLPRCIDQDDGVRAVTDNLAAQGLRVLAVARRAADSLDPGMSDDEVERDLTLLGLLAMQDPPRPGVSESIAQCREAGIRLAMLTGDHPRTALAIAQQIGLIGPDGTVLSGDDLPDDDAALRRLLDRDGVVLSRVTPEQKLSVARTLQGAGHVVAMTGDGVNDAPALRQADIGVAMGLSGTDVAREAADLVLLDDHFSTIVDAVEQGRATYANIRRFLTYHLTDNVAELTPFVVWAVSGGHIPLAIGVLQILCLDIVTDLLPALALGGEAANPKTLHRPPERRHIIDPVLLRRVFGVLGPTEAVMEMTAFLFVFVAAGWRPGDEFPGGHVLAAASGAAFATVIVGQAANAFACRSATKWPGALGWTTNRLLLIAVATSAALMVVFLTVPGLADLLGQAIPPVMVWPAVLAAAPVVLAADGMQKVWRARRRSSTAARRFR